MPSHRLTILGLGPGDPRQRTREADEALAAAPRIILRTNVHPGLDDFLGDPRVTTCDDLYETSSSFAGVYDAVVDRVWSALDFGDVVYAVPGHPLAGERAVCALLARAETRGQEIQLVAGISGLDAIATALRQDLMSDQPQLLDAVDLHHFVAEDPFNGWLPECSPVRPVIITQIYSRAVASSVKLALTRLYPEEHEVVLVTAAGVPGEERIEHRRLFEVDRADVDHLTSLWVPPLAELDAARWPLTMHRISARLRAPDGCPWDRKQTHRSLRSAVIEEAYEVADSIDEDDPDHLAEELGDLLLQVALHAQIAEEAGRFAIGDVYEHINRKLIRRHPHVFADAIAETPEAVIATWEGVKAQEQADRGAEQLVATDPLDRLPRSMPILTRLKDVLCASPEIAPSGANRRDRDGLGTELFDIVQSMIASGLDPERELERIYRAGRGRQAALRQADHVTP